MEQNETQHFTSFLPCQISENSDPPYSCTLVLDITKTYADFNIYKEQSKDTQPVKFDYKKYDGLLVSASKCVFINENDGISSTFFFFSCQSDGYANNNLRRFVFALADAGMLIPENEGIFTDIQNNYSTFHFIPEHSFVPDGFYNFINHLIYRNVRKICVSRIRSFKNKEDLPLNPKFYYLVFPYLHSIEDQKLNLLRDRNANRFSLNFVFLHHLKTINKILAKPYDKSQYKKFKNALSRYKKDSQYLTYFQMIDSDFQEFNSEISNVYNRKPGIIISQIHKEKWTLELSEICKNICKVYVLSHDAEYFENQFIIAIRIALLLKNGEKLQNIAEFSPNGANKREIEVFMKEINENFRFKTNEELEILIFSLYSTLMRGLTKNISSNLCYDFSMEMLEYFAPTTFAFFVLKGINSLNFLEKMIKNLFLFSFKSPWIAWFFIMRTNDRKLAVESIVASIIYHLIPKIVNEKVDEEMSIERFLPNFEHELQNDTNLIKDIIDVASNFYMYHNTAASAAE